MFLLLEEILAYAFILEHTKTSGRNAEILFLRVDIFILAH